MKMEFLAKKQLESLAWFNMMVKGEKIKVTLKLTESLLSIFKDMGKPLVETMEVYLDEPTTLRSIVSGIGINPILVPFVRLEDRRQLSLNYLVSNEETITLIGPIAGG